MKTVGYRFIFGEGREKSFIFVWNDGRFELEGAEKTAVLPAWTDLDSANVPTVRSIRQKSDRARSQ
jgi:hypothetical protein